MVSLREGRSGGLVSVRISDEELAEQEMRERLGLWPTRWTTVQSVTK